MNRKKRKLSVLAMLCFVLGLVLYLAGIIMLFSSSLRQVPVFEAFFSNVMNFGNVKLIGGLLFLIGFIVFMVAVVLLYKNNNVIDNTRNLIIEGKADVITLIVMTYVMIFMVVVCLLYDELIGALLFGVTIIIQTTLNSILISYYSKMYKKK